MFTAFNLKSVPQFGTNEITGKAKYLINDDDRLGIVVGKWEIYCYKKIKIFSPKEQTKNSLSEMT